MAEEAGRYQLLEDVLEPEMVKQYRIRRGAHCVYMPRFGQEKYLCPCGAINPMGRSCYVCGLEPEPLTREVMEQLSREAAQRIEEEERQRAEQEKKHLAREESLRKRRRARLLRRVVFWAGSAVAALSAGILLFWLSTRVWIPAGHYNSARQALEAENWQEAHRQFTLARNYKDAQAYLARFSTPTLTVELRTADSANLEEYTYDASGNRLEMTLTNYALLEDGGRELLQQRRYLNIYERPDRPLQLEDFYYKEVYNYNDRGDLVSKQRYRSDGVPDHYKYFNYEYDETGRILRKMEICSELISVNYSYEYEESYTYDGAGRVSTVLSYANYPASPEGNYHSVNTYTYDGQGRVVTSREEITQTLDQSGDGVTTEQWVYSGELLLQYTRDLVHGNDARLDARQTVTYTYDAAGRLLYKKDVNEFPGDPTRNFTDIYEAAYDRQGRLLWEQTSSTPADAERYELSGFLKRAEYTYDLLGRLSEEKWVYDYPESASRESYASREVFSYGLDGAVKSGEYYEKTPDDRGWRKLEERQYNENGLLQRVTSDNSGRELVRTCTYAYFYDRDGTAITDEYPSY